MRGITAIMVMRRPHRLQTGSISLSTMDRGIHCYTLDGKPVWDRDYG